MPSVSESGYPASEMGPQLLEYVERQLLGDLRHYGVSTDGLAFDWSYPCQEGHRTKYLDGHLEEMSNVSVLDPSGRAQARGWIDFVHGARDAPLFVFWLVLDLRDRDGWRAVKSEPGLPTHVWAQLPERSKQLCMTEETYDARWARDPLVLARRSAQRSG